MSDMTIDIVGYLRRNLKHPKQLDFTDDIIWFVGDMEQELALTKKQLKIALDALKEIDKTRSVANHKIGTQDKTLNSGIVFCWATPDEIHNALEQITALEQKDIK